MRFSVRSFTLDLMCYICCARRLQGWHACRGTLRWMDMFFMTSTIIQVLIPCIMFLEAFLIVIWLLLCLILLCWCDVSELCRGY